jgi:hypothetical protein
MVRGAVPGMIFLFTLFKPSQGVIMSGFIVSVIVYIIGIYATLTVPETHGKDLDYLEV